MGQDPEELFDVVDDHDRVIAQAPRREVHARRLKHRAVHVLVRNRSGRIFLHQRSWSKDSAPGKWDSSCAGHVAAGDDYDATVLRELGEELGWRTDVAPRRILRIDAREETGWEFVWVYLLHAEGPFVLDPSEIIGGDWFLTETVDAWVRDRPSDFASAFLWIWPRVREGVRPDSAAC